MQVGGGFDNIMKHISTNHPDMLEPLSRGKMPMSHIYQPMAVGRYLYSLSLPQSVVRGILLQNTKSTPSCYDDYRYYRYRCHDLSCYLDWCF